MAKLTDRTTAECLRLVLRITPKGGRDAVEGFALDANGKRLLKVRIAAAPEDGKANASLMSLLAREFGVAKGDVTILRGAAARVKQVQIRGNKEELATRLAKFGVGA